MDAKELQKENERLKATLLEQRLQFQNELKVRLKLEGQKHQQELQRFKEAQLQHAAEIEQFTKTIEEKQQAIARLEHRIKRCCRRSAVLARSESIQIS